MPRLQQYALTQRAPYVNHWVGGAPAGNYGADYRLRTVVNLLGIWANTSDEVVYFNATRDAHDKPLDAAPTTASASRPTGSPAPSSTATRSPSA